MVSLMFSQRYGRSIRARKLVVDLSEQMRRRLWALMKSRNQSFRIQRDPDDQWTDNTDTISETVLELQTENAWSMLPGNPPTDDIDHFTQMQGLLINGPAEHVFDALEKFSGFLDRDRDGSFPAKVSQILELEDSPWRLLGGEFIKLDESFVGARATQSAVENLAGGRFSGAMDEYVKACREQAAGEVKDAIADACKSYESVLKVLTGMGHVNADRLTKGLVGQGWLEDLPQEIREGFRGSVLMSLPLLRNKMAGHGQGAEVVNIAGTYGTLALQLAAALNNFLVAKQLERNHSAPEQPKGPQWEAEIPF